MTTSTYRLALVTGGSSGIGAALADALAARGTRVVVADLNPAGPHEAHRLDVTDAAAFAALVDDVERQCGPIDLLCNNAGVPAAGGQAATSASVWDRTIAINLRGVVNGIDAVYPRMVARRSGTILNTASLAGLIATPGMLAYTTTKHAVVGLTRGLRAEAAQHGVRVSALCPGFTDTPLLDTIYTAPDAARSRRQVRLLQGGFMRPDAVAAAALAGLDRNRSLIVVGRFAHVAWYATRLSPAVADAVTRATIPLQRRVSGR